MKARWVGRTSLGLAFLIFLVCSSALAQQPEKEEKPWTGRLYDDGRVITKADLDQILQDHKLWLESDGKTGKKANFQSDDLSNARIEKVNLSRSNLNFVKLREATLREVNLSGASLRGADLRGADLSEVDLSGANLTAADLRMARLWEVNLSGANLYYTDLSGAHFEPKPGSLPGANGLTGIKGLDSLTFSYTASYALGAMREIYKKAGMREEERQVTYALNRNRRVNAWKEIEDRAKKTKEKTEWAQKTTKAKEKAAQKTNIKEGEEPEKEITWLTLVIAWLGNKFQQVMFEWTCDYGMTPSRPLLIMFAGLFVFTPFYLLAFRSRGRKTGIWLVLPNDESSKKQFFRLTKHTPFRPLPSGIWARFKTRLSRGLRLLRLAFYFSLLSAFNLGWRELNVGNWISRLQKREYALRAKGWVRTVAGLQSLISVYMLALWVLTYFGRPFD